MMSASVKDYPWRVKVLDESTAGKGLFKGFSCLFTISNYWSYGHFVPQEHCELPGKLFRAKASGEEGAQHVYVSPVFWGQVIKYLMKGEKLYATWQVKRPIKRVSGGHFSLVCPQPGPWQVWCNPDERGVLLWHINVLRDGQWVEYRLPAQSEQKEWRNVQIVMEPRAIILQFDGRNQGRFEHDAYPEKFIMTFGSGQTEMGGKEVISEYRSVFFHNMSYPYGQEAVPDGPEDIRPQDKALYYMGCEATPERPRRSEGDLIELRDGSLFLVWSDYYAGKGWDSSPARLAGKVSKDGGKTWDKERVIVNDDHGTNVMSASLLRAHNGDILLVYLDQLPEMSAKGMILRRSNDEGKAWSDPMQITPESGNIHAANNACLRMLSTGRIILSCREYISGIRWPYCLYSDDDGYTWKAGEHVPDTELTPEQKNEQNVNEPSVAGLPDGRLLMTMRSIAGGQFFSYSSDGGETWTKPYLSSLLGTCSPAAIKRIPGTDDVLAIFTYGYTGRTPLTSAISSDGGKTWKYLKLIEQSEYYGYCYASITFVKDRVYLTYMHYPNFTSLMRFEAEPSYTDLRLTALPIKWFYRDIEMI
jgi:hypothetical protein